MATTPEEQQQWLAQWRAAEKALYSQKFRELQALTDEEALRQSNILLAFADTAYRSPERERYSGLAEQQRIFHGRKKIEEPESDL